MGAVGALHRFGGPVATYAFETMTPAEALAVTAADAILFPRLAANQVTVLYNPSGTISILAPGRALEFGPALASLGAAGRLILPDDARLFVGDAAANTVVAPGQQIAVSDGLYGGGGDLARGARESGEPRRHRP